MSPDAQSGLVSVIVPTYNRSRLILPTLESVHAQGYRPIELIVVDDGSTDGTSDLLTKCKSDFERSDFTVRLFEQENKGAPAARNIGLSHSNGEFIQFLDSDDLLHPRKLEIHTSILNPNTNVDYVWSDFTRFTDVYAPSFSDVDVFYSVKQGRQVFGRPMNLPQTGWSGTYRRKLCVDIGPWNESLDRWQDFEYNVRAACENPTCFHIPRSLHGWRVHELGRIEDKGGSKDGVKAGFVALRHALKHIRETNNFPPSPPITRPCMQLVHECLVVEQHHRLLEIAKLLNTQPGTRKPTIKTVLLWIIASIVGPSTALRLSRMYSRLRLN
jgi:glycosyltransferase involved in cell wall biosynthesis